MSSLVLDASALIELLIPTPAGKRVGAAIRARTVCAPQLIVAEVLSALRRLTIGGQISALRAEVALADLSDFPVTLFDLRRLSTPAWALRGRVTAYDAMYVALAQGLDCPLVTLDARLARAVEQDVEVLVPGP